MVIYWQLLVQNLILKTIKKQLTLADFGLEFGNLIKIKHIGHIFHSILVSEFEFEGKIYNFIKMWISKNFAVITLSKNKGQHLSKIVI